METEVSYRRFIEAVPLLKGGERRSPAACSTPFWSAAGVLASLRQRCSRLAGLNRLYRELAATSDAADIVALFGRWLEGVLAGEVAFSAEVVMRTGDTEERWRVSEPQLAGDECAQEFALLASSKRSCAGGRVGSRGLWGVRFSFSVGKGSGLLLVVCRGGRLRRSHIAQIEESLLFLGSCLQRAVAWTRLQREARRDSLTGLANRRAFEEESARLVSSSRRFGRPLSLIAIDLDNFKKVNDICGHSGGDDALRRVAGALTSTVRDGDLVARPGGDEFVVLLAETPLAGAERLAARLCEAVRELGIRPEKGVQLTASAGSCQLEEGEDVGSWLERADALLYSAKAEQKAGVQGRREGRSTAPISPPCCLETLSAC